MCISVYLYNIIGNILLLCTSGSFITLFLIVCFSPICMSSIFICSGHPWLFHLLALLGGLMAPVAGGNAKAILLNVVQSRSRGTVFGVYNIMDDLGKGLGPALVSSWVRPLGRRSSFMLGILFWLPCGLFCWMMTRTVLRDDLSEIQAEEAPTRDPLTINEEQIESSCDKGEWHSCETWSKKVGSFLSCLFISIFLQYHQCLEFQRDNSDSLFPSVITWTSAVSLLNWGVGQNTRMTAILHSITRLQHSTVGQELFQKGPNIEANKLHNSALEFIFFVESFLSVFVTPCLIHFGAMWSPCCRLLQEATVSPPTSLYSSSMGDTPSTKPQARAVPIGKAVDEASSCDECWQKKRWLWGRSIPVGTCWEWIYEFIWIYMTHIVVYSILYPFY